MNASTQNDRSGQSLAIATLITIFAAIAFNALSNLFPPGGLNIGQIANTVLQGVLITPANFAFAIWGVIYLGLIAYGFYQLRPAQRLDPTIQKVDKWLILACVAQIAWVYLFTLQLFWWSVPVMLVILGALIGAYLQLQVGKSSVSRDRRWFAQVPFSIYLSWISVATIVNIASALYSSQWDGWGMSAAGWTGIMLWIGAGLATAIAIQRADISFTLVFVWAYTAVGIRHFANPFISMVAFGLAIALTILIVLRRVQRQSA